MDWILFGHTALWLGILSWFDIRKREIPHSAWVIIPLILAGGYRIWQGDWKLVLLAAVICAVSERERISILLRAVSLCRFHAWLPVLFLASAISIPQFPLASLAAIGFWIAWELHWWGGADAVAALSAILLYPELKFVLAFLFIHVLVASTLWIRSLIQNKKTRVHIIPGLPLLLGSLVLFQISNFLT